MPCKAVVSYPKKRLTLRDKSPAEATHLTWQGRPQKRFTLRCKVTRRSDPPYVARSGERRVKNPIDTVSKLIWLSPIRAFIQVRCKSNVLRN
ncbi:hypothetical protein AVEN_147253-1 [Araneus ventricosus]|uniref:Uncharacterized protein n=1 Tax=Araneus ventricosus TaxID=182803 RepID=A0A4Y2TRT8_ARAVE|nr:hypothetical protein AVEN_147253-1 [Araneus ventricosus]